MIDASKYTNSLFEKPWWLNALSPSWEEVVHNANGEVRGRLIFQRHRVKSGFTIIGNPPLTQTIGPWLSELTGSYANSLGKQHEIIKGLLDQLPDFDSLSLNLSPSVKDILPFHWAGFNCNWRCTYRITDLTDMERVYSEMTDKCRNIIRKAEKQVTIRDDRTPNQFYELVIKTWARQGRLPPYSRETLLRLDAACLVNKSRVLLMAEDANGVAHAGAYLVYDDRIAYYLLGGADPDLRASGAQNLVVWHAIQHASKHSRMFDFEGSMVEPIEHSFRSFGAVQVPYINISKESTRFRSYTAVRKLIKGNLIGIIQAIAK